MLIREKARCCQLSLLRPLAHSYWWLTFSFLRQCSSRNAQGLVTSLSPLWGWVIRPVAQSSRYEGVGTSAVVPTMTTGATLLPELCYISPHKVHESEEGSRMPLLIFITLTFSCKGDPSSLNHWGMTPQALSSPFLSRRNLHCFYLIINILYLITHPSYIIVHLPF